MPSPLRRLAGQSNEKDPNRRKPNMLKRNQKFFPAVGFGGSCFCF